MKKYVSFVFDGVYHGFLFVLLIEYTIFQFLDAPSNFKALIICIALLSSIAVTYFCYYRKFENAILKGLVISFISFLAILILDFINLLEWKISIIPTRELVDPEGIFIIMALLAFTLYFVIVKTVFLISALIRNRKTGKTKRNTGEGTMTDNGGNTGDGSVC